MAKEIKKGGRIYYLCECCGLAYFEKKLADKCQEWCRTYKTCNLELMKHSVKI